MLYNAVQCACCVIVSYTKPKGQLPDYTSPIVLKNDYVSIEDFCNKVHRSILKEFKQYDNLTCYPSVVSVSVSLSLSDIPSIF